MIFTLSLLRRGKVKVKNVETHCIRLFFCCRGRFETCTYEVIIARVQKFEPLPSRSHLYTLQLTNVLTQPTAVTFILVYDEFFGIHLSCFEIADISTISTIIANFTIGILVQFSLVAFLLWIEKIATAIITAEADTVRLSHILLISERSGYQMLIFCFL